MAVQMVHVVLRHPCKLGLGEIDQFIVKLLQLINGCVYIHVFHSCLDVMGQSLLDRPIHCLFIFGQVRHRDSRSVEM